MIKYFKKRNPFLVYNSEYLVSFSTDGEYKNFDIYKYKRIRDRLIHNRIIKPQQIIHPKPCTLQDLKLIHTDKYLRQIQDPIFVNKIMKIQINSIWENMILEYFKAVCGGTVLAAQYALEKKQVVFNLGGGFHHAHPEKAEGFCLINDVAIAISRLEQKYRKLRFLIIDLDYHQGNGNALIFNGKENVFTFSVHADHWEDIDSSTNLDIPVPSSISESDYISVIKEHTVNVIQYFKPDIIFYIAGSDPYEMDSLGDMKISRDVMLERNMFVLTVARDKKLPVVIVPGGGYGKDSWHIYYDFIEHSVSRKYV